MEASIEAKRQFDSKLWIGQAYGVYTFNGSQINARLMFVVIMGVLEQIMQTRGLKVNSKNPGNICNSLAVYCLVIQLLVRLGSKFIKKDDANLSSLVKTIVSFYEREEQVHSYQKLLIDHLKLSNFLLNGYLLFLFFAFIALNCFAWILSWYTGDYILLSPLYFPIIDHDTLLGFIINSGLLLFYTLLVYFCFMAADVVFLYFVLQTIPMINIICMKLASLGENLVQIRKKQDLEMAVGSKFFEPSTSMQIKYMETYKKKELEKILKIEAIERQLVELIKEFTIYNDFVKMSVQFVELTTFMAITLNSAAIAMAIIVIFLSSKFIGFMLMLFLLFEVLMPCIQGTLISYQKEKMLDELWKFPWFELTVEKQKIFLQFMILCQYSNEFNIPIIGNLNLEVFARVINGVYSYLMYLLNFVEIM